MLGTQLIQKYCAQGFIDVDDRVADDEDEEEED